MNEHTCDIALLAAVMANEETIRKLVRYFSQLPDGNMVDSFLQPCLRAQILGGCKLGFLGGLYDNFYGRLLAFESRGRGGRINSVENAGHVGIL
jgi:hypothetical protein